MWKTLAWDPGELRPVTVDNTDLDIPTIWLNVSQLHVSNSPLPRIHAIFSTWLWRFFSDWRRKWICIAASPCVIHKASSKSDFTSVKERVGAPLKCSKKGMYAYNTRRRSEGQLSTSRLQIQQSQRAHCRKICHTCSCFGHGGWNWILIKDVPSHTPLSGPGNVLILVSSIPF